MNISSSITRRIRRTNVVWILLVLVFLFAVSGLGLLSRHALRLSEEQSVVEQREDLQQDVRVALWRLDSRLAPFIATVHSRRDTGAYREHQDDFVITRFRIGTDSPSKSGSLGYRPATHSGNPEPALDRLTKAIPLPTMLAAVVDLIDHPPTVAVDDSPTEIRRSKSQQYSSYEQIDPTVQQQSDLVSRNEIVRQQVSLNRAPDPFETNPFETDPFASNSTGTDPWKTGQAKQLAPPLTDSSEIADEPMMISFWVDNELFVVRSGSTVGADLEGVWIDWPKLRASLLSEISDLMPGAAIRPLGQAEQVDADRTLASLPAVLESPPVVFLDPAWSTTHGALLVAWLALVASLIVAAIAVHWLVSLSERRAAFVSAVTHELRTPLTTFRLYSDLLARDLVSDPNDRAEYFQTLRREADRLTHLVDNVLRYSKLQRTTKGPALETIQLSDWIERMTPRLSARLAEVEMELVVELQSDGAWNTDPPAMEQIVFNLVDNAAKYANPSADQRVHLIAKWTARRISICVLDHGPGVPAELQGTMFRPFEKSAQRAAETAAGVGLGLALVKETASALGGSVTYRTGVDGGAMFAIEIPNSAGD